MIIIDVDDIDSVESCVKIFAKKFQYIKGKEVYELQLNEIINSCNRTSRYSDKLFKHKNNKVYIEIIK